MSKLVADLPPASSPARSPAPNWVAVGGAVAVVMLAAWLRWRYLQTASPHVDEYITLWAARRTLTEGYPLLPSGVVYPRGLPISYLMAAVGLFGGVTVENGRWLNVLFGVGAVALTLLVGWRTWRPSVGLFAALGLAVAPEAIEWSARARFYAPMQFFALLTVWAAYRMVCHPDQGAGELRRRALLFGVAFILALWSQEVTIFLYPALLVAMVWWRGWRFLLQPAVLAAQLCCLVAIGARFLLDLVGQPGQFATFQQNRPYVSLGLDVPGAWSVYGPLLIAPERLLWMVGVALAAAGVLMALVQTRGVVNAITGEQAATLFFLWPALFLLLLLLTVAGGEWREVRFFLAIQPLWLLVGAAGIVGLLTRTIRQAFFHTLATIALLTWVIAASWSGVQESLRDRGNGLDAALAYVAAHRQSADLVLTSQPSACAFVVGDCTYYARTAGYEPYVIGRAAGLVDRYVGLPLLDTAEQLTALLHTAPAVWLVLDQDSLTSSRYSPEFLHTVVTQFDLAFAERGGIALRTAGWRSVEQTIAQAALDPPLVYGPLLLTAWQRSTVTPGQPLDMTLFWRTSERLAGPVHTSLQIVAADGTTQAQQDSPVARGLLDLQPGRALSLPDPKRVSVPADLAPGRYRIDALAYPAATGEPFSLQPLAVDWFWHGPPPPPPAVALDAVWQNGLRLNGHSTLPAQLAPGTPLSLTLQWSISQPITVGLTTFVHLIGSEGQLLAQNDHQPEGGFYPTNGWDRGERIDDQLHLDLPADLETGVHRLLVGWYNAQTGERIPLQDGRAGLELAQWQK